MPIHSLQDLIEKPFKAFTKEEQQQIVQRGRFTDLTDITKKEKDRQRNFSVSWYKRVSWLTCNTVNKKLYCWNCVLFSHSPLTKLWVQTGFDDLKNLSKSIRKHEESREHTYATIKLKLFAKAKRTECKKIENNNENVNVKRNRDYLERLIDVASTLIDHGARFRNDNDDDGLYKGILCAMKRYDDVVRAQLEEHSQFEGIAKSIQIDLVHAIAETIRNRVIEEITECSFVALQVDEVPRSNVNKQIAISLRYVKDGRCVERCIGFYHIGSNRKVDCVAGVIINELEKYKVKGKLVAQCYDGGVVPYQEYFYLQQTIKTWQGTQNAIFCHSYAHNFSDLISRSLSSIQECKLFFAVIDSFQKFFKTMQNDRAAPQIPEVVPSWVNTVFSCITTLNEHPEAVNQVLGYVLTSEDYENDPAILSDAYNLQNHMEHASFKSFLVMFDNFFTEIENTFNIIKETPWSAFKCRKETNNLINYLKQMKTENEFRNLLSAVGVTDSTLEITLEIYIQIIDHVIHEIVGRFLDIEMGDFCGIFQSDKPGSIGRTRNMLDHSLLKLVQEQYPILFDYSKLKIELELIYNDPSIIGVDVNLELNETWKPSDMLAFMFDHDIDSCLPSAYKLLELINTIPSIGDPLLGQRCVLNRIKSYCKKGRMEEPEGDLAILSIEKELFTEARKSANWYQSVAKQFARLPSTKNIDLIFERELEQNVENESGITHQYEGNEVADIDDDIFFE